MVYDSKFSPSNINILKECIMDSEDKDLGGCLGKNSYLCLLILEVPGSFYCRHKHKQCPASEVSYPRCQAWGQKKLPLPSRFFWSYTPSKI